MVASGLVHDGSPNLFAADDAPKSIIAVCRSPVRGEIFVLKRDMGQGAWDMGNWEGEAPAEPKTTANGE